MKKRFLFTLASFCLMLCVPLTSCETNEVNETTETTTIENQVKIKGAKTLDVGETVSLSLLFSQKTVPVIWQSLTPSIVTVSQDGVVTALNSGEGKVAVQASDDPTIQDVVTIVVNEVIEENVEEYTVNNEWWKEYNNEELNKIIDLALKNNPDYIRAGLNVNTELYKLRSSKTSLFPSLSGSLGASSSRNIFEHDDFTNSFFSDFTRN